MTPTRKKKKKKKKKKKNMGTKHLREHASDEGEGGPVPLSLLLLRSAKLSPGLLSV